MPLPTDLGSPNIPSDPELLRDFVTESSDRLCAIEHLIADALSGSSSITPETVNEIFRGIHSIKGVAGILGLSTVTDLAHRIENVLDQIRHQDPESAPDVMVLVWRAIEELHRIIGNVVKTESSSLHGLLQQLDAICATVEEVDAPHHPNPRDSHAAAAAAIMGERSTRISVADLDWLSSVIRDLPQARDELLTELRAVAPAKSIAAAARINLLVGDLQHAVEQMRLVPLQRAFQALPRVVDDLCRRFGKKCRVTFSGESLEVDKTIIEALSDPLVHLLRNALDHGIESPVDRVRQDKNMEGSVIVAAEIRQNELQIRVSDDGKGIDPAQVLQTAIHRQFITSEKAGQLSREEAIQLIFWPGFSTANKVTEVSGRGVGMDVVCSNIQLLGGSVGIESQPGKGTIVLITLPLDARS